MNKSNNTQQAAWIAIGSLFSFGFTIASSMILSRYFLKEDYGTYKQVIYVYTTMLTVFTLGLPKAFSYFLPRVYENQAKSLIKKITNLFFLLGGLFSVILFFGSDYIALILKNPDLAYALKVFSPVPFLMLPTMGLEGILATFRKTKFMALYTVVTRVMMLLCVALPVILFDGGYIQAIIGFVIASFVSFLLALYLKYYPVRSKGNNPVNISYKEIFRFSLPLLAASVWSILISSTDQFFISRYFGPQVFAEFSNGSTPLPFIGMIVGATATVFSPIISKISHTGLNPREELLPLWNSIFEKSVKLVYPLLIFSWFYAEEIMMFLYGEKYAGSYIYFRIFNLTYFFKIIAYAPLIINIGKTRFYANVNMIIALSLVVTQYIILQFIESSYAIIVISVLFQIGRTIFLLKAVADFMNLRVIELFPLKIIAKIVIFSIVILSFIQILTSNFLQLNPFFILVISFTVYSIIFYMYSIWAKLDYISIVKPLLSRFIK